MNDWYIWVIVLRIFGVCEDEEVMFLFWKIFGLERVNIGGKLNIFGV